MQKHHFKGISKLDEFLRIGSLTDRRNFFIINLYKGERSSK